MSKLPARLRLSCSDPRALAHADSPVSQRVLQVENRDTKMESAVIGSVLLGLVLATVGGCAPPSFLITPVSARRALVETELSRDSFVARDKIALISISGLIINVHSSGLLSAGEHPVSLLLEELDKARRDRRVKAVILRINSPGGGVVASELIHAEIKRFRQSGKPVIAVFMDVAASGGYYVACACDEIVAQPSTVTGSIGVIMRLFEISETMKILGIKSDAITSGRHKDTGSMFRPMRSEEREIFQTIIDQMYERFVDVVAAGRPKLDKQAVRKLADGRIYSAGQALELGLIDRIAPMHEVIEQTKKRIGSKHVRLVAYHRPHGYRPNYYATASDGPETNINLFNINLPSLLTNPGPQFLYLWQPGG